MVAAVLLAVLLIAGFVLAWRRAALGRPLLVAAGMVIGGILAAGLVSLAANLFRAGDFWRAYPLVAYLAVYAALLAAMAAIWARWGRGIERRRMRAAAWLLILILGAALSLALPGATIFFLIAPAMALAAIALSNRSPSVAGVLAVAAILVQFLMVAQLLALMEILLIDGPLAAVAPLGAIAALPAIVETNAEASRPTLFVLLVVAVVMWIAALLVPRASAERPLGFSIDYFRDAAGQTADWAVATKQAPLPSGFPGRWHNAVLPYNGRTRWVSDARLLATPIPQARIAASEPTGVGRRIQLILSPGGGNSVAIRFPKDAKLLAMGLPGAAIQISKMASRKNRCCAVPAGPVKVSGSRLCWETPSPSSPSFSRPASGFRPRGNRWLRRGQATPYRNMRLTRPLR